MGYFQAEACSHYSWTSTLPYPGGTAAHYWLCANININLSVCELAAMPDSAAQRLKSVRNLISSIIESTCIRETWATLLSLLGPVPVRQVGSHYWTSERMTQSWRHVSSIRPRYYTTWSAVRRSRRLLGDGKMKDGTSKRASVLTALVWSTVSTAAIRQSRMLFSRGTTSINNRGMPARVTNVGSTIR